MAFSLNEVVLCGNLGRDAEVKYTQSGASVANFSVATTRSYKDKTSNEWKEETNWTNCVFWGSEKVAALLKKGTKVTLKGRLQTRSYDDKDGKKVYATEVVVETVIPQSSFGGGQDAGNGGEYEPF